MSTQQNWSSSTSQPPEVTRQNHGKLRLSTQGNTASNQNTVKAIAIQDSLPCESPQTEPQNRQDDGLSGMSGHSSAYTVFGRIRALWPNRPKQMVCYEYGKKSLTRWSVLEVVDGNSRLKLSPITGRSHQLRIHCEALGHPILGDNLYGTAYSQTATKELCLHAQSLTFNHPTSGERLTFSSEPDF